MGNPIRYIHPAAFIGLLVLDILSLESTQLYQLPPSQDIGNSLTTLIFSSAIYFESLLNAHTFAHLRKIRNLYFWQNGLKSTPLGMHLIANTVVVVNLRFNAIKSLTSMESVKFTRLRELNLADNNISHLRPEMLIMPTLQYLNVEGNDLVALAEVTQYSWGSSLPKYQYMTISLRHNPWHCNGSLFWMLSNLYRLKSDIIYANPPRKPYIRNMDQLFCESPAACHGTTVVPRDNIESAHVRLRSLHDLAGKCCCHIV